VELNFIGDSGDRPKTRSEVRIEDVRTFPLSDRRRIVVELDITPFIERPSLVLSLYGPDGRAVGEMNVIEMMEPHISVTLHIREEAQEDRFLLEAAVYYLDEEQQRMVVDSSEKRFELAADERR